MASMIYPARSLELQSALCVMTQPYLSYLFVSVRPQGPVRLQPIVLRHIQWETSPPIGSSMEDITPRVTTRNERSQQW